MSFPLQKVIRVNDHLSDLPLELLERSISILSIKDMTLASLVSRIWRECAVHAAKLASEQAIGPLEYCIVQMLKRPTDALFSGVQLDFNDCPNLQNVKERICVIQQAMVSVFLDLEDNQFNQLRECCSANTIFGFENLFWFSQEKRNMLQRIREGDFQILPAGWSNDRDVVMAAVQRDGSQWLFASERLQEDEEIVRAAVHQNMWIFAAISSRFKEDRDLAFSVVLRDGRMLRHVSESLQDDMEIVQAAFQQNGSALQYASLRLQILFNRRQ